MHAIVPFYVPVPQLFEAPGVEASGDCQLTEPTFDRHMDPVWRGVSDDEAGASVARGDPTDFMPGSGHVVEVGDHHAVVCLLAATLLPDRGKPTIHVQESGSDGSQ